ncbi:MAG: phospho-N-acetylmuramoyl-pentapeptide-transferase [Victivallales bacterium]|jgi:phospho-N-acetylmuramoyl-pentapeptide-transferase|nr:phospho-N-acetylmuramoyl-pentapeptide-transferase [Victivallales bacterium]
MLYLLSLFGNDFLPFRLFKYVTFRAGGAAITAFLIVVLLGSFTARQLRRLNAQSAERLEGLIPAEFIDKEKSRTPCMGGILLIGGVLISACLWNVMSNPIAILLVSATFAFALVGFYDDFRKVVYKDRNGLAGRYKILLQIIIASLGVFALFHILSVAPYMSQFMVPFFKTPLIVYAPFTAVVAVVAIVATSNAVNLTDGKDGLATGCTIFCSLAYAAFAYLMGHSVFAGYLKIPFISGAGEGVVFAAAICGGCIGFLWHNCHPASMFMGDTGSLALGGAIGMLAVLVRQEVLLLLVGGVFVMEAGSVMLQVPYFKLTGKRIFPCTPIHHTFERRGWTETQIVVRFWILSGLFSLLALATLKLR